MKLIHYGDTFYQRSGSAVGALYHEDGERSDWGKVKVALDRGEEVHIRPATKAEMRAMEVHCEKTIAKLKADGWGGPWDAPTKRRT